LHADSITSEIRCYGVIASVAKRGTLIMHRRAQARQRSANDSTTRAIEKIELCFLFDTRS
jgi:hypothetical protein